MRRATRATGVTLVEMLMVVVVFAILATLGAPHFARLLKESRLTTSANRLVQDLHLARSEAVKRAATVTLCPSTDGAACATDGRWEAGWILFADADADQAVDAGEAILRREDPLRAGHTLRGSTEVSDGVTFDSRGTSRVQGTFVLCVDAEIPSARVIGVRYVGRIRRGIDADRDGTPENLDGSKITSCDTPS